MAIILFSTIGLSIIISMLLLRKKVKAHHEQLVPLIENSIVIDDPFDDFMCMMLTDGSTIISGKTVNGETFIIKGNRQLIESQDYQYG